MALVELKSVSFSYEVSADQQAVNVIRDISFRADPGQVIAIMGGSGVGKTTLLRMISGLVQPNSGQVFIAGYDLSTLGSKQLYALRREIGCLFQFGALFTDLSVFDNVAFPLRELTDLPERIISDLVLMKLEAVGLRGARDLMPHQLSGGMSRRVALARAIALDPKVILYDEPFAGLDPISLSITGRLIREVNQSLGACSIMVTHDVEYSFELVDYVYFLGQGGVVISGTPRELRRSQNPFVKQFVHGLADGATPFHYEGTDLVEDFLGVQQKST